MSSTRPHAERPESLSNAHDVTSLACLSLSVLCLYAECALFRFVSDSNKLKSALNVLILKIRLDFVFHRCEKKISAFDSSLGNVVDCRKKGEISDKYMCNV